MTLTFKAISALFLSSCFVPAALAVTLDQQVKTFSQQGWQIGLSVMDMDNKVVSINGDRRFPLDSTVKALACANVLAKVDQKSLSLEQTMQVTEKNLVTHSPVAKEFINKPFTLRQAYQATTAWSDNTGANFALSAGGGPAGLTAFMRSIGDELTRSDRYEPELTINPESDVRDTTTPNAMNASLKKLLTGNALSETSKQQLKAWMMGNRVADNMLRASLPAGWKIADRSGASDYGIRGLTSMVWSESHPPVFISIYVRKQGTTLDQRSEVIRVLGRHIVDEYLKE